jgi:hypothetical protein
MTLSERNLFFKIGIVFCALIVLLTLAASFLTVPVYSSMEENSRRPTDFFQFFVNKFIKTDYYAVHASLAAAVLFSFTGMLLIHFFFERTTAPEILFVAIFTISFSFEAIRLILPLYLIFNFSSFYLLIAARILLFARYFSIFSLFTASVCAAGFETQKTRNVILVIFIAVLFVTLGVPIDTQSWDTAFNMISGYTSMFRLVEIIAFLATVISFFVAAHIRSSPEYIYIGIGVILALAGKSILLGTDNWAGPVPGILLLSFGTWFLCSKLHKLHLWR